MTWLLDKSCSRSIARGTVNTVNSIGMGVVLLALLCLLLLKTGLCALHESPSLLNGGEYVETFDIFGVVLPDSLSFKLI